MNFLNSNKEWIFSGIGTEIIFTTLAIVIALIKLIFFRKKSMIKSIFKPFNINIGSNNSIINKIEQDDKKE